MPATPTEERCQGADELLSARGETFAFKWCTYAACILTWLTSLGIVLKDVGKSNLGMDVRTVAQPFPSLKLFDLLSWCRTAKPESSWSGFHALTKQVCPLHHRWLKEKTANAGRDPKRTFAVLMTECQSYHDLLREAGILVDGQLTSHKP